MLTLICHITRKITNKPKKNKKIKNDIKAVEELDKFMVEGINNAYLSDDEQ